ncbi:MAG: hypothetical protein HYY25_04875 [Candidatus Wallbacteria bacterium]|nr:hypothetical protein [Candidatus Wallbacteria bacterium]
MARMRPAVRLLLAIVLALLTAGEAGAADELSVLTRRALVLRQELLDRTRFRVAREQQGLGGKNEKLLLEDGSGGRWLFKVIDAHRPLSLYGEVAASALSVAADGRVPPVHSITLRINGQAVLGSIQRLSPISSTLEGVPPERLSGSQLEQILELQVFDWMAGDHDTKGQNKGVLPDGQLVNFDKTQFWRFGGTDRLDWTYHPNARPGNRAEFNDQIEPYANKVWKAWIGGKLELEPAAISRAVGRWELLEDELIRELALGFAWVRSVLMPSPMRLTAGELLERLLARKRSLRADCAAFLARASQARGAPGISLPPAEPGLRGREVLRLRGLVARLSAEAELLGPAPASRAFREEELSVPMDDEARLRVLKFKSSDEPFDRALADLRALLEARTHPMARAGVGEYIERLRRLGRGEVRREELEHVVHGRGY